MAIAMTEMALFRLAASDNDHVTAPGAKWISNKLAMINAKLTKDSFAFLVERPLVLSVRDNFHLSRTGVIAFV
ncbi:hypothetical protein [Devosia sp. A449]